MQSQLLPQPPFALPEVFKMVQGDQQKLRKDRSLVIQDSQGRICKHQYVMPEASTSVGIHQSRSQTYELTY